MILSFLLDKLIIHKFGFIKAILIILTMKKIFQFLKCKRKVKLLKQKGDAAR